MTQSLKAVLAACVLAAVAPLSPAAAEASDAAKAFPSRPVRLVVPFGAGSGPDLRARQLGQKLAERWGQAVIVDNRPGAGGQLAMDYVARSAPDGYTLAVAGQSNLAIAPNLAKQPYDPLRVFAPVTRMSFGSIVLVVNGELPARNLAELIDYARRNPGKLNAASWGNATIPHLALELFAQATGVKIAHVPYKSGPAQYLNELMSGQIQLAFDFYPAIGPQLKANRLRALAVSGAQRLPLLPDVPTFTEAGLPAMEAVSGWQGIAAPAHTPREVVAKLQAAIAGVLALPEVRTSYRETGFDTVGDSPEEFAAFIRSEHARWGKLIAEAAIRVE